jgi:hypothetical protein
VPCIFCLAVFALMAGAITSAVLDEMERRLETVSEGPVQRTVDSGSVTTYETQVVAPRVPGQPAVAAGRPVPVRVTVYKKHKRVRIQVMTHDLSRAEAEALEDLLAAALELTIVDRSDAHDEEQVREAFGEEAVEADRAEAEQAEQAEAVEGQAGERGQQPR